MFACLTSLACHVVPSRVLRLFAVIYPACAFICPFIDNLSSLLGNPLPSQRANRAKAVTKYGLIATTSFGLVIGLVFIIGRKYIAHIYSSDPDVWDESERIQTWVGISYFAMALFYASMATLDGQGRPMIVAVAFLLGAWGLAVPLSYVFGFTVKMGLLGLWYGLSIGYGVVTLISTIAVYRSDWPKLAETARERAERSQKLREATQQVIANSRLPGGFRGEEESPRGNGSNCDDDDDTECIIPDLPKSDEIGIASGDSDVNVIVQVETGTPSFMPSTSTSSVRVQPPHMSLADGLSTSSSILRPHRANIHGNTHATTNADGTPGVPPARPAAAGSAAVTDQSRLLRASAPGPQHSRSPSPQTNSVAGTSDKSDSSIASTSSSSSVHGNNYNSFGP